MLSVFIFTIFNFMYYLKGVIMKQTLEKYFHTTVQFIELHRTQSNKKITINVPLNLNNVHSWEKCKLTNYYFIEGSMQLFFTEKLSIKVRYYYTTLLSLEKCMRRSFNKLSCTCFKTYLNKKYTHFTSIATLTIYLSHNEHIDRISEYIMASSCCTYHICLNIYLYFFSTKFSLSDFYTSKYIVLQAILNSHSL